MTVAELVRTLEGVGIQLFTTGDRLRYRGPVGAMTPELRAALTAQKQDLLPVLRRLEGMRATVGHVPLPCAVLDAKGGPGRCFSCGAELDHPAAYGRCVACSIAVELFYRERPEGGEREF